MTAVQVKDALYARHFASSEQMPGAWTCVEEWRNIDLLAFSAWASTPGGAYARIGYEVKVSRSDLRTELLKPEKRRRNVEWCNEFYFAVPSHLLTAEELAWEEPEWQPEDFVRAPCVNAPQPGEYRGSRTVSQGPCWRGKREGPMIGPVKEGYRGNPGHRPYVTVECDACQGKGYSARSHVETSAPTCWVPRDVGLIVVDGRGTRLVKKAPRRKDVPPVSNAVLGQLIRFVSMRPDPRHLARHVRIDASVPPGDLWSPPDSGLSGRAVCERKET